MVQLKVEADLNTFFKNHSSAKSYRLTVPYNTNQMYVVTMEMNSKFTSNFLRLLEN